MPKKHAENPLSLINFRINHATSTSGVPFQLEGLPAEAWKCLCLVAWKRLERINPRWADLIEHEVGQFKTTWLSSGYWCKKEYRGNKAILSRRGGNVGEAWLVEAFQSMLNTSAPKQGPKPLDNPRWILTTYEQLLFEVKTLKTEFKRFKKKPVREQKVFWREQLQAVLNRRPYHDDTDAPDDPWRRATVTDEMIETARLESASEVALAILHHLHNDLSPSTLKKKLFPRLRKTPLSPIELWRDKLLKSPQPPR